MRKLIATDRLVGAFSAGLGVLAGGVVASRPSPTKRISPQPSELLVQERQLSGALMRVNHVGEVCAQALYQSQALLATDQATRDHLNEAAGEERDHLVWTEQRLKELGARQSLLNPLWYLGSFGLGLIAARFGRGVNLGFVRETERQVEAHLAEHLERLPNNDYESRAIVEQMRADEARHAEMAQSAGATELPGAITAAMKISAKLMTTTAHYI
jgi:3-demethoxyubiquinol 3-hydroxylase